jgi:hypothetical protein
MCGLGMGCADVVRGWVVLCICGYVMGCVCVVKVWVVYVWVRYGYCICDYGIGFV